MVNEDELSEVDAMSDTTGSECLGESRGSHVGQKNFKKAERKVLRACVTPACLCGLATVALTEKQQQLQMCENNWVCRITRTKWVDKG